MTPEEIWQLSDSNLTRLVAERVMGWTQVGGELIARWFLISPCGNATKEIIRVDCWQPLTDMNHLWQVVERMRELGWLITIESWIKKVKWRVSYMKNPYEYPNGTQYVSNNDNLNRAVLEAALMAVETKD